MNGFANGTSVSVPAFGGIKDASGKLIVASFDATGTATIQTHPTPAACTTLPRPNGSGSGITALHNDDLNGTHCIQFARSSSDDSATRSGQNLTYIPFAQDGLTFATASVTGIPKNLTLAQLTSIYSKNGPSCGTLQPLLPQAGSGSRGAWLKFLGLTETTLGNCVKDNIAGVPIEEHDGRVLTNPNQLVPYSVAQYITQTTQPSVTDRHGTSVLRAVNGLSPYDPAFPLTRKVFNVIRSGDVGVAPFSTTFVTTPTRTADICAHSEVIRGYGFTPISDCGSTTIHTS
jgi:hypothetical protein